MDGEWDKSTDPVFKKFGEIFRASFIPCGMLSYMPWRDNDPEFKRAWDASTGRWVFQCSLKNYENEIEQWFEILPYFIEKIDHLEYLYEEDDASTMYGLVDGKVVRIGKECL